MKLGIIGGGRAAWAFGSTWRRMGWPLTGIMLRSEGPIARLLDTPRRSVAEVAKDSEVILVAVSDGAIAEVAASIPQTPAIIFHPSGILTSVRGGFSLHPLKALPPVGEPSDLRDALLVFEGAHRDVARRIADSAGARFAEIIAAQKALYHAAAVFGSNYVAALLDVAEELIGVEHAREDIAALAQSAIDNWRKHADSRRFTGPAVRGDQEVIERHLAALQRDPKLAELYRLLAERILATRK
jgi:predicted short-subunit dehydrogenase-like oxidoreductase (DUF2520 family)